MRRNYNCQAFSRCLGQDLSRREASRKKRKKYSSCLMTTEAMKNLINEKILNPIYWYRTKCLNVLMKSPLLFRKGLFRFPKTLKLIMRSPRQNSQFLLKFCWPLKNPFQIFQEADLPDLLKVQNNSRLKTFFFKKCRRKKESSLSQVQSPLQSSPRMTKRQN